MSLPSPYHKAPSRLQKTFAGCFLPALLAALPGLSLGLALPQPALAKKAVTDSTTGPSQKNYREGLKMYERGDYDGAIDAFLQAVYFSRNGYEPDAYYHLGLAYLAKKDYQKSYDALQKSCSQAMSAANDAHLALGEVCTAMKKYKEALDEEGKAFVDLQYGKGIWNKILVQQGMTLDASGAPEAALAKFSEALGREKWHDWVPWIHYCECLMKVKDWVKAHQSLDEMLTTNATIKGLDFERVHLDLGICDLAKGNHQGALDNWHKVLEYNPDNKEAHLQLALMLDSEQHIKSAIAEYKYFMRMAGSDDDQRVKQVETRIAIMEQMLHKEEPPAAVQPSPYMRNQQKEQQAPQATGDPGF